MDPATPVPKPRTKLNILTKTDELNGNKPNVESRNLDNNLPSNGNVRTSLYPFKEAGLDDPNFAPVKPPRSSATPPPRPPPPATIHHRVAPPPPPSYPAPSPPLSNCGTNSPVPGIGFKENLYSDFADFQLPPASPDSSVIENPGYMSLHDYRQIASPSSGLSSLSSLFLSHNKSPQPDVTSQTSSCSHSPAAFGEGEITGTVELASLDDLIPPAPDIPIRGSSIDNAYTPAPARSDFSQSMTSFDVEPSVSGDRQSNDALSIKADESSDDESADGTAISFFGFVKIHVGKKERKRAHARLRQMCLSFHEDDETDDILSGPFHLTGCQMICRQQDTIFIKLSDMETQKNITFTVEDSDSVTWSLLLGECWVSEYAILKGSISTINSCGFIWLKHGAAADWQQAICAQGGRSLHYVIKGSTEYIYELDLRKVLDMREKLEKDQWHHQDKKSSHRGASMLTLDGCSLYFQCDDDTCTSKWYEILHEIINSPAMMLNEYRLTSDNVPMVVEKCIRFISSFGLSTEGIYRRNGKISEAKEILQRLIDDPAGTHLVPVNDETAYAVADVLRQFFRKLPSPLFPLDSQTAFLDTVTMEQSRRVPELHRLVHLLPTVNFSTLRKLMSHLKEVSDHSSENRASFENLAKVFGPSLFHTDNDEMCFKENSRQISVIAQLILDFDQIFNITPKEESAREMIENAQKYRTPQSKAVRAQGLLVPIHLFERENRPFNVKTDFAAEEVCREAVAKRGFDAPVDGKYALIEVIRGSLRRQLDPAEKLADIVINRWIPWKCLDGYLLFDHDKSQEDKEMSSFSGKVKIAEPSSKSFKAIELKIEDGTKLVALKSGKAWKTWDISQLAWYLGSESARKAPYNNNATFFILSDTDCTEKSPGYCISFKNADDCTKFSNRFYFIQTGGKPPPLVHI